MAVERISAEERAVADDVDHPRHAVREPEDLVERMRAQDVGGRARDAEPMAHVGAGLPARERIQVIAPGDALRELPQLVAREELAQLRLADENDLQELRELLARSEEHTSELQSPDHLVCRLLLEKKKEEK